MNEIKVTVTYDKPNTSKFDALMAEYEAAKKYADETVAYYKPLADAAEEAKMDAILKQLETIKEYAKRLSDITNESVWIKAKHPTNTIYFEVVYRINGGYDIAWGGHTFDTKNLRWSRYRFCIDTWNILGMWDEWRMYEQLDNNAMQQLRGVINKQTREANAEKNRLYNITKGGN